METLRSQINLPIRKPPCKCPHCGREFRGNQALSKHINSIHMNAARRASEKMLSIVREESSLKGMLKALSDQLSDVDAQVEISPTFTRELKIQDAKIRLALRVVAYGKIQKALQISSDIGSLTDVINKKWKATKFEELRLPDLLRLRDNLEKSLSHDLDYLKGVCGFTDGKEDELLISKLIDVLASHLPKKTKLIDSTSTELPDDPQKREVIRQEILKHPQLKTG